MMLNAFNVARPVLRNAAARSSFPTLRAPYSRFSTLSSASTSIAPLTPPRGVSILRLANAFQQQQKRGVASSVSGRPGSQTPAQAAQNVKEEVGNSAADLARTIAGGNYHRDDVTPEERTFVCYLFSHLSVLIEREVVIEIHSVLSIVECYQFSGFVRPETICCRWSPRRCSLHFLSRYYLLPCIPSRSRHHRQAFT